MRVWDKIVIVIRVTHVSLSVPIRVLLSEVRYQGAVVCVTPLVVGVAVVQSLVWDSIQICVLVAYVAVALVAELTLWNV